MKYLVEVDIGALPPKKAEEYLKQVSDKVAAVLGDDNFIILPMDKVRISALP